MSKLFPRCINGSKFLGHSASGWICPCCWHDPNQYPIDEKIVKDLYTEDLKIENVKSIEDILYSEAWFNFMDAIQGPYKDAPSICKEYCSKTDQRREVKRI
jgi:hypothetical protein